MTSSWLRIGIVIAFLAASIYSTHRLDQARIARTHKFAADLCHGLNAGITETNHHGAIIKAELLGTASTHDEATANRDDPKGTGHPGINRADDVQSGISDESAAASRALAAKIQVLPLHDCEDEQAAVDAHNE